MVDIEKPKYQKLKEYIIEMIKEEKLKSGERIYSENELAKNFGISRHTVRQAIGELVNEGWLYRIQGKGTYVDSIRSKRTNQQNTKTIAVVTTYLNDYIFPSIILGIDSVLSKNGYNIILSCTYNNHEKERLCLEKLKSQNIDGLIVEPTKSALPNPNIYLYRDLRNLNIPMVFIHGCYKDFNCSYVVEDDVKGGYDAASHLIDLGHRRIGGIFKSDDIQGHYRFEGFKKAHEEAGLVLDDSRILWFDTHDINEIFSSNHEKYIIELLSKCSGFVCYNEQIVVKVMNIARQNGFVIPDDISFVGFDDSQLASVSEVKLTTVAHPKEKLGEEAAKVIIGMIEKNKDNYYIKMEPELIIRSSTRKIMEER